jgi:hypothetical protein
VEAPVQQVLSCASASYLLRERFIFGRTLRVIAFRHHVGSQLRWTRRRFPPLNCWCLVAPQDSVLLLLDHYVDHLVPHLRNALVFHLE